MRGTWLLVCLGIMAGHAWAEPSPPVRIVLSCLPPEAAPALVQEGKSTPLSRDAGGRYLLPAEAVAGRSEVSLELRAAGFEPYPVQLPTESLTPGVEVRLPAPADQFYRLKPRVVLVTVSSDSDTAMVSLVGPTQAQLVGRTGLPFRLTLPSVPVGRDGKVRLRVEQPGFNPATLETTLPELEGSPTLGPVHLTSAGPVLRLLGWLAARPGLCWTVLVLGGIAMIAGIARLRRR